MWDSARGVTIRVGLPCRNLTFPLLRTNVMFCWWCNNVTFCLQCNNMMIQRWRDNTLFCRFFSWGATTRCSVCNVTNVTLCQRCRDVIFLWRANNMALGLRWESVTFCRRCYRVKRVSGTLCWQVAFLNLIYCPWCQILNVPQIWIKWWFKGPKHIIISWQWTLGSRTKEWRSF